MAYKVAFTDERLAASAVGANGSQGVVLVAERDSAGEGIIIGQIGVPNSFAFGLDLAPHAKMK